MIDNQMLYIDRDKFNEIFNANLKELPSSIVAVGFYDNQIFFYNKKQYNILESYSFIYWHIEFWKNNVHNQIINPKYYFLYNFYDGLLERTPPNIDNIMLKEFEDKYYLYKNEISISNATNIIYYPILHKNVHIFSSCKLTNDPYTLMLPDFNYCIQKGYSSLMNTMNDNQISFQEKKDECVWRGTISCGNPFNFGKKYTNQTINQREYFSQLFHNNKFQHVNFSNVCMSSINMMKYKYILDIDGHTNSWDGLFWKLYSGSVVLKTKSIWKQWFYNDLKEYVHYIPIEPDFSDLNDKIKWCMENQEQCIQIASNAQTFVKEHLNWDIVVKYTVNLAKSMFDA